MWARMQGFMSIMAIIPMAIGMDPDGTTGTIIMMLPHTTIGATNTIMAALLIGAIIMGVGTMEGIIMEAVMAIMAAAVITAVADTTAAGTTAAGTIKSRAR